MFEINQTIVLDETLPEYGLIKGMQGVIVSIFYRPNLAYEVEFCDSEGRTIIELALRPSQIKVKNDQ